MQARINNKVEISKKEMNMKKSKISLDLPTTRSGSMSYLVISSTLTSHDHKRSKEFEVIATNPFKQLGHLRRVSTICLLMNREDIELAIIIMTNEKSPSSIIKSALERISTTGASSASYLASWYRNKHVYPYYHYQHLHVRLSITISKSHH